MRKQTFTPCGCIAEIHGTPLHYGCIENADWLVWPWHTKPKPKQSVKQIHDEHCPTLRAQRHQQFLIDNNVTQDEYDHYRLALTPEQLILFKQEKWDLLYPSDWTPDKAKEELPLIFVSWQGQRYTGKVIGRQLPYAHVYGCDLHWQQITPEREVAWYTIAHSLNTGQPIKLD